MWHKLCVHLCEVIHTSIGRCQLSAKAVALRIRGGTWVLFEVIQELTHLMPAKRATVTHISSKTSILAPNSPVMLAK